MNLEKRNVERTPMPKNLVIVPIGGDCGFANVNTGHVDVMVDTSKAIQSGDLGVFELNGNLMFKKYELIGGMIVLTEPNKEVITISADDDLSLIGKAKSYYVSI